MRRLRLYVATFLFLAVIPWLALAREAKLLRYPHYH